MTLPSSQPTRSNGFSAWDAKRRHYGVINSPARPVKVNDYVLDTSKWGSAISSPVRVTKSGSPAARRNARKSASPPTDVRRSRRLAEGLLSRVLGSRKGSWSCASCGARRGLCAGPACRDSFRANVLAVAEWAVEIRHTGHAKLGYGVFVRAGRRIAEGEWLGEYLGEVLPVDRPNLESLYSFALEECIIDASTYGSWTRFVNHACEPNAEAVDTVVGERLCIVYRALRDIEAGEQLMVNYGTEYFEALEGMKCVCPAEPGPHSATEKVYETIYLNKVDARWVGDSGNPVVQRLGVQGLRGLVTQVTPANA